MYLNWTAFTWLQLPHFYFCNDPTLITIHSILVLPALAFGWVQKVFLCCSFLSTLSFSSNVSFILMLIGVSLGVFWGYLPNLCGSVIYKQTLLI